VNETDRVLLDVYAERARQDLVWGKQTHHYGTSQTLYSPWERRYKQQYTAETRTRRGPSWTTILLEEAFEAAAETDLERLRAELVQVAAVAVNAIENIDRDLKAENDSA
jgi:NTP pyrophosphatase (non-canonical NTP hydrolase)